MYIPALISLGLIAVSFSTFLEAPHDMHLQKMFGYAVAIFLICITLMIGLLVIPEMFRALKRPMHISLMVTALVFLLSTLIRISFDRTYYLAGVTIILMLEILYLNSLYYRRVQEKGGVIGPFLPYNHLTLVLPAALLRLTRTLGPLISVS